MPSLNLKNKTLRFAKTDETALQAALALCTAINDYSGDEQAKRDATSAKVALAALSKHVDEQRNGKADAK